MDVKIFPVAALAAVMIIPSLSGAPALAGDMAPRLGAFDTLGKNYLVATVDGAADGLRARGWDNPAISARITRQIYKQSPEIYRAMDDVRARAKAAALAGDWNEQALEGYLEAIEVSAEQWRGLARTARQYGDVDAATLTAAISARDSADLAGAGGYRLQAMARGIEVEMATLNMANAYETSKTLPSDHHRGDMFLTTAALRETAAPELLSNPDQGIDVAEFAGMN